LLVLACASHPQTAPRMQPPSAYNTISTIELPILIPDV
jgi:hypothetical protein